MKIQYCIKAKNIFNAQDKDLVSGSILISGSKIYKVVRLGEEEDYIDDSTVIIDAGDMLVMPGFIDAHTHFFSGALAYSEHVCCEIANSRSEQDCVDILKKYEKSHPKEKRIRGRGWFITNWNTTELPTKKSLDEAFGEKPVYLQAADCHSYWCNSAALRECGITKDTKVSSGFIGKLEDGELSGMLVEMEACAYADRKFREFSEEDQREICLSFMEKAAEMGVTSLSEMMPGEYDEEYFEKYCLIKDIADEGKALTRLHLFTKLYDVDDFDVAIRWRDYLDGDYLKLSGVKGFIDGVAETYTGLLLEPYSDRPDTCGEGVPIKAQKELNEAVTKANCAGLPVRIHCIADGSVRMALEAFKSASAVSGKSLANTIEHIENIHPDDIAKFKELGVIPSMQPIHILLDADGKISKIGDQRIKYEWPLKSMLDAYGSIAIGTDYPVVDINPFENIYAAVTRKNFDGTEASHNPWEKLSMYETLMGYTAWAAQAYSRENEIGRIQEKMFADLIIIDRNLFDIDEKEILNAKVALTMLGGKITYSNLLIK